MTETFGRSYRWRLFVMVSLAIAVGGCGANRFQLAQESRLPRWFCQPVGTARSELTVTLTFMGPGDRVEVALRNKSGKPFGRVVGTFAWHFETEKQINAYGGLDPDVYPRYVVIRCNGVTEIVEQREFGGSFYITDDPELRIGMN